MNDRIKQIRKSAGLNQDEFAAKIGLTKNFISLIETGSRTPSDRTISDICREFNVNEDWLRNGTGDMHPPMTRGQEIGEIVRAASSHNPDDAQEFFHKLLDDMSYAEIVLMYEIVKRHFKIE